MNSDFSDIATALTGSIAADGQTPITGPLKCVDGTAAAPAIAFSAETTTGIRRSAASTVTVVGGGVDAVSINAAAIGTTGNILSYANTAVPVPVGIIQDFAGSTAPLGWLLCAGQVVAQASYPELFAVCGSTYNTGGEGAGNFRLPDCRGRVTAGKDNMNGTAANRITVAGGNFDGTVLGGAGGSQNHTMTQAEMPAHTHTFAGNALPGHTHHTPGDGGGGAGSGLQGTTGGGPLGGQDTNSISGGTPSGTNSTTGSGNAFTVLSPAIIFNKIIFAGRP